MFKDLIKLSNSLYRLGLTREAESISNLIKTAYINEARIQVELSQDRISATLKGRLPSGNSADFGYCYAMNLTDRARLASSPSASIWEFHREIDRPEYSGLGYMNELLTTIVSQVQNNGGVAFNGIGSEMVGSMVSSHGRSHTLEKLGKSLSRTPVIVFYQPQHKLYLIFEPSDRELAKKEFLAGYGVELSDNYLDHLFSTPYERLSISEISPKLKNIDKIIISAFKITATSAKTSIPVSLSYEGAEEEPVPSETDKLFDKRYDLKELYRNLQQEYYKLLEKIFPGERGGFIFIKIVGYQEPGHLTPDVIDSLLEDFILNSSTKADQEAYFSLKPQMQDLWRKAYETYNEIIQLDAEIENIENEYEDRAEYVGQIRNRYDY